MSSHQVNSTNTAVVQSESPRYENGRQLLIAGIRRHYTSETMNEIFAQWHRFSRYIGNVPGQVGRDTFGLSFLGKGAPGVDYLTGVEVSSPSGLPPELEWITIPAQKYAVFVHPGHVSTVRETCEAIGARWLPESGRQIAPATEGVPDFFERYTTDFNPESGIGGIEIWVPIK